MEEPIIGQRWPGIRPSVRGVAKNAYVIPILCFLKSPKRLFYVISFWLKYSSNDYHHGNGRGKFKPNKHPVSILGWDTKGTRTKKNLERREPRTVIRWSFASVPEAKKSKA